MDPVVSVSVSMDTAFLAVSMETDTMDTPVSKVSVSMDTALGLVSMETVSKVSIVFMYRPALPAERSEAAAGRSRFDFGAAKLGYTFTF